MENSPLPFLNEENCLFVSITMLDQVRIVLVGDGMKIIRKQ